MANEPEIVFTQHAVRRAAERGADIAAVAAMCQRLAPRLSCFSGHRVALVRPGQPIPVVRPRGRVVEVLTVLAPWHQIIRNDTLAVRV
jgi:hypothetical protein